MTLYHDLKEVCAANNNFLPLASIRSHITEEHVTEYLDSHAVPVEPALIRRILEWSRRLFVILVLLKRHQDVHTILADLDDSMIPFPNLKDVPDVIGNSDQRKEFFKQQDACPPPLTCHLPLQTIRRPPFREQTYRTSGGFSEVYKVKVAEGHLEEYDSNEYMACKEIFIRRRLWEKVLREVQTLIDRRHKYIVPLVACFHQPESGSSDERLTLLFPWAPLDMDRWMTGDTPEGLGGEDGPRLRKEYLYETILSLLSAVSYLHREIDGMVTSHHDLKPENFLLVGKTWMIGDLGKSHIKNLALGGSATAGHDGLGTFEYQPPEYADHTGKGFNRSFDIWSMGCIIVELAVLIVFGWETKELERFTTERAENQDRPSSFEGKPGKDDISFHNNMTIVHRWMTRLEDEDGSRNFEYLMETARAMLSSNEEARPYSWEVYLDLYEHFHPDDSGSARGAKIQEFVPLPTPKEINNQNNPLAKAIARKDRDRVKVLRKAGWTLPGYEDVFGDLFAYGEIVRVIGFKPSRVETIQLFIQCYQARHYAQKNTEEETRHCVARAQRFADLTSDAGSARFTATEIKRFLDQRYPMDFMAAFMSDVDLIHLSDDKQYTHLHWAAQSGDVVAVDILLRYGAEVDPVNKSNETPLMIASLLSHPLVVKRLLQEPSVQINHQDTTFQTSLSVAVQYSRYRVVQLLLEHDADYELSDRSGSTPFYYAARAGNIEMVELLLKHGANPKTRNRSVGDSPLESAQFMVRYQPPDRLLGYKEVIKKLEELNPETESAFSKVFRRRKRE